MKFIHAADIHLDSPLQGLEPYEGAPVEEIRGAVRAAFEALVELCLEEAADFLVLAGDLYDGDWRDFNTGLYFVRQMVRLREAGIPVFVVQGNHDAQSQITRQLRLPDNVHVFASAKPETHMLEHLGVALHGQSFATQHVTDNLAAAYPAPVPGCFNIGVLHTALEGYPEHPSYAPCTLAQLTSAGYDYWALGHVHQHLVLAEEPHVVFPGNLQGRHSRETGPKGCCVVEVEDGRVQGFAHRPLDGVRWARLEVDVAEAVSLDDVVQATEKPLVAMLAGVESRVLAVRMRLAGQTPLHAALERQGEELTNQLRAMATDVGGGAIYVERVEQVTTAPARQVKPSEAVADALELISIEAERLAADPGGAEALRTAVRPLLERLPAPLKARVGSLSLERPESLHDLLRDAQDLVTARLADGEEDA
jgi:DNA repair exonuclease SbcCD nuclease subunit